MSIKATEWAWSQNVSPSEKILLLALADHADSEGVCWPSLDRMQEMTGLNRSTVTRNLKALESMGIIYRERSKGGSGLSTRYRLNTKQVQGATVAHGNSCTVPKNRCVVHKKQVHCAPRTTIEPLEPPIQAKSSIPPCPHKEIVEIYHRELPGLQRVVFSRWPGSPRAKDLLIRWKEDPRHQDLAFWEWFFQAVRSNGYWMGQSNGGWAADIGWLLKRANFDKVIERGKSLQQERRAAQ